MLQTIASVIFLFAVLLVDEAHAAKVRTKILCVNPAGDISVRPKCQKSETPLKPELVSAQINQIIQQTGERGPQGSIGVMGAQGVAGMQGAEGDKGSAGPSGVSGVIGQQGPVGPQGLSGLQGPPGAKGIPGKIDFTGCRRVSSGIAVNLNGSFMVVPGAVATVACNSNTEFVFSDGFTQSPLGNAGTKAFIQSRQTEVVTIAGDTREYQVTYAAERFVSVGNGQYTLEVSALCCPR